MIYIPNAFRNSEMPEWATVTETLPSRHPSSALPPNGGVVGSESQLIWVFFVDEVHIWKIGSPCFCQGKFGESLKLVLDLFDGLSLR